MISSSGLKTTTSDLKLSLRRSNHRRCALFKNLLSVARRKLHSGSICRRVGLVKSLREGSINNGDRVLVFNSVAQHGRCVGERLPAFAEQLGGKPVAAAVFAKGTGNGVVAAEERWGEGFTQHCKSQLKCLFLIPASSAKTETQQRFPGRNSKMASLKLNQLIPSKLKHFRLDPSGEAEYLPTAAPLACQ